MDRLDSLISHKVHLRRLRIATNPVTYRNTVFMVQVGAEYTGLALTEGCGNSDALWKTRTEATDWTHHSGSTRPARFVALKNICLEFAERRIAGQLTTGKPSE